jgi:hypothetical protein
VAKAVIFDSGLHRLMDIKHHECRIVKNAASVEIDMKVLLLSSHVFCAGSCWTQITGFEASFSISLDLPQLWQVRDTYSTSKLTS